MLQWFIVLFVVENALTHPCYNGLLCCLCVFDNVFTRPCYNGLLCCLCVFDNVFTRPCYNGLWCCLWLIMNLHTHVTMVYCVVCGLKCTYTPMLQWFIVLFLIENDHTHPCYNGLLCCLWLKMNLHTHVTMVYCVVCG